MPAAETIDILMDDAMHRAAMKLQTNFRGIQARKHVDNLRTTRIERVVGAVEVALVNAKRPEQASPTAARTFQLQRAKTDAEIQEDNQMNEITVKSVMKKLQAAEKMPWTQRTSFSMSVGFVIFLNAVCMGAEADYGTTYPLTFLVIEHIFTAVFSLELLCHWCVIGPRAYFSDSMNWLDFSLVAVSVIDVWIIGPLGIDADLRMMSLFRMLRLIRLARLLRLLRMFKELTLLVSGFVASVKTLFWALVFLTIMVYIFSIFARQTIGAGGYEFNSDVTFGDDTRLFGSVDRTMLTLFVCLTEGCGMDIIHPTVMESPALFIFWAAFVFFTTYGLLNLIVGCFCENAMKLANENEKEILENRDQQRMHLLRHMKEAFSSMDDDSSGTISKKEFTNGIMGNRNVMDALTQLGLDEEEALFDTLDSDNLGVITFDQFFDGASLIMKGQETAKAKDIVSTQLTSKSIQRRMRHMDNQIHGLRKDVNSINSKVDKLIDIMSRQQCDPVSKLEVNLAAPVFGPHSSGTWTPSQPMPAPDLTPAEMGKDDFYMHDTGTTLTHSDLGKLPNPGIAMKPVDFNRKGESNGHVNGSNNVCHPVGNNREAHIDTLNILSLPSTRSNSHDSRSNSKSGASGSGSHDEAPTWA
jgi:voltage-gated sodium channel